MRQPLREILDRPLREDGERGDSANGVARISEKKDGGEGWARTSEGSGVGRCAARTSVSCCAPEF